jgi:hypothetical protein
MRFLPTLVAAVVGGAVAAAIAFATIPDSSGTINGCYSTAATPHPLSVVDAPADCKDTLLPFNQTGPRGPAGTVGGVQLVFAEIVPLDDAREVYGATVSCPAGRVLLSGGFDLGPHAENYDVAASKPVAVGGVPHAWDGRFALKPAIIRERAVADTLLANFRSYVPDLTQSEEEGTRQLRALFRGLIPSGLGGKDLSAKERNRIAKGIKGLSADDGRLRGSALTTSNAINNLLTFARPATIPEAAVFALCGSA